MSALAIVGLTLYGLVGFVATCASVHGAAKKTKASVLAIALVGTLMWLPFWPLMLVVSFAMAGREAK